MKPGDAEAVSRFVEQGGQVRKVPATMTASEQDVLAYLAECGLTVKYIPGTLTPYACLRRRYSISGLVRLANTYRMRQQLAPMMVARNHVGTSTPNASYNRV